MSRIMEIKGMERKGLVIFDLDGVLIQTPHMHAEALKAALTEYGYNVTNQSLDKFNAIPTLVKLTLLDIPEDFHNDIYKKKQEITMSLIEKYVFKTHKITILFSGLRSRGYKLAICTNSIRQTLDKCIELMGIEVDASFCNQDAKPKPSPDMYNKCMRELRFTPCETLIVEDSPVGIEAAISSGANVLKVTSPDEVTYSHIFLNADSKIEDQSMQIVIPAAGLGLRFSNAGYKTPKPLIDVNGIPMIEASNLCVGFHCKEPIAITQPKMAKDIRKAGFKTIVIERPTEGAACTLLLSEKFLNPGKPLCICNSDQIVSYDWISAARKLSYSDGVIITFESDDPKWSYVSIDEESDNEDYVYVNKVAEKKVISSHATCGIYLWRKAGDFFDCARAMIRKNIRVNGEFYVCPVYNEAIARGMKISIEQASSMDGLGTPEDLEKYLKGFV